MKDHKWMTDKELVDEFMLRVYAVSDCEPSPSALGAVLRSDLVKLYRRELMRRLSVAKDQPRGSVDKFAPTEQANRKGL